MMFGRWICRMSWTGVMGITTADVFDPNLQVDTGWGSVLGGPDGMTFSDEMRQELGAAFQTTPADFAALEVDDPQYYQRVFRW